MLDFEKLGAFYLGRTYDLAAKTPRDELVLYDSKDLVTHAVCVGMTGSGKTGLGICLLEEAAIDGVPAIVIDPKGDLANLLLTFPQLEGADFEPWIQDDEARQQGLSPQEFAQRQADAWRQGLAASGQDAARIQRLRDAAEFNVYTPGSSAGLPLSILSSFKAPDEQMRADGELLRERVSITASSLLGLLGVDSDPLQGREHILLSTILGAAWREGRDLDPGAMIQQIQTPPTARVGVMDIESFFPSKDRFGLAMQLNALLAAPGFEAWLEGEPLDVQSLLYSPQGKPRVSIISIAHLSDSQRMFFVSLLLNEVLGWTRRQSGTTSLRAIVYMDEIFGYFPPVANPPSKLPLLTLLKQARAFGVGIVLATQNPVDLDYKGLSNAGTWFIGRLQTERDKMRVLEGLEGAAATHNSSFDRGRMEQTLAALGNRVFLMNNVHEDGPVVFQVRWALSYLRGPLTRSQIKQLADGRRSAGGATTASPAAPASAAGASVSAGVAAPVSTSAAGALDQRPLLQPGIPQFFLPARSRGRVRYRPMLLGIAKIYFSDAKTGVDAEQDVALWAPAAQDSPPVNWDEAEATDVTEADLEREPSSEAAYLPPAAEAASAKNYEAWKKSLVDSLFRGQRLELLRSPGLAEVSQPGESERDFRIRLQQSAREQRDGLVEKLRAKYASKIQTLKDRLARSEQAVEREEEQAKQSKFQTAISFGATLLGALTGRKVSSLSNIGKATTAARGVGRSLKESKDVDRAGDTVERVRQQLADLEAELQTKVQELDQKVDPALESLEKVAIKPKKTNITPRLLALVWQPEGE